MYHCLLSHFSSQGIPWVLLGATHMLCVRERFAHYITHSALCAAPLRLSLNESCTPASVWEERGVWDWRLVSYAQEIHNTASSWLAIGTTCEYMFEFCVCFCVVVLGVIWDKNIELCCCFERNNRCTKPQALYSSDDEQEHLWQCGDVHILLFYTCVWHKTPFDRHMWQPFFYGCLMRYLFILN